MISALLLLWGTLVLWVYCVAERNEFGEYPWSDYPCALQGGLCVLGGLFLLPRYRALARWIVLGASVSLAVTIVCIFQYHWPLKELIPNFSIALSLIFISWWLDRSAKASF